MKSLFLSFSLFIGSITFSQTTIFSENFGKALNVTVGFLGYTTDMTYSGYANGQYVITFGSNSNHGAWVTQKSNTIYPNDSSFIFCQPDKLNEVVLEKNGIHIDKCGEYEFSIHIANVIHSTFKMSNGSAIVNPDLKIEILENAKVINTYNTGVIKRNSTTTAKYQKFATKFKLNSNNTKISFKITNLVNHNGGSGNDFIMDDISILRIDTCSINDTCKPDTITIVDTVYVKDTIKIYDTVYVDSSNSASLLAPDNGQPHLLNPHPNPAINKLTVGYRLPNSTKNSTINIHNIQGRLVKQVTITSTKRQGEISLDISELSSGIYFCSLILDGTEIEIKKFEVSR